MYTHKRPSNVFLLIDPPRTGYISRTIQHSQPQIGVLKDLNLGPSIGHQSDEEYEDQEKTWG
jgi:hypothetical protein